MKRFYTNNCPDAASPRRELLKVKKKTSGSQGNQQLTEYLETENILTDNQIGFGPVVFQTVSLDCICFVRLHGRVVCQQDRGLYNIVVFLDLKKAFVTVNFEILLKIGSPSCRRTCGECLTVE